MTCIYGVYLFSLVLCRSSSLLTCLCSANPLSVPRLCALRIRMLCMNCINRTFFIRYKMRAFSVLRCCFLRISWFLSITEWVTFRWVACIVSLDAKQPVGKWKITVKTQSQLWVESSEENHSVNMWCNKSGYSWIWTFRKWIVFHTKKVHQWWEIWCQFGVCMLNSAILFTERFGFGAQHVCTNCVWLREPHSIWAKCSFSFFTLAVLAWKDKHMLIDIPCDIFSSIGPVEGQY